MKQQQFIKMLAKLKQEYLSRSIAMKTIQLSVEDIAQLLYKYMKIQPFVLKEMLFKSTGKFKINWDDLLSFLQEDIAIEQEVKKVQISPLSATEIIERHTNEFASLISYVRLKETNQIQSIQKLSASLNQALYAVCLQKELIFYDQSLSKVINSIFFKYSNMKDNQTKTEVIKKQNTHKKQKDRVSSKRQLQQKAEQMKDKVGIMQTTKRNNSKLTKSFNGIVNNTLKSSHAGSELSSDKSKSFEKIFLKMATDHGVAKKKQKSKSNLIKIKNDDVCRVFQYFSQASINNSIKIAQAFTQARSNFHNHIVLDQSYLDKDKTSINFQLDSAHLHKNYTKQLEHLRRNAKSIEIARIAKSVDINNLGSKFSNTLYRKSHGSEMDFNIRAVKKMINIQKSVLGDKMLSIVTFQIFENYLIISLFNRQVRLFRLSQSINRINQQMIFSKHFDSIVSSIKMYRSQSQNSFKLAVLAQKQFKAQFIIYHLDQNMYPSKASFHLQVPFSAKCSFFLPFGASLFNELGYFYLVQLNNFLDLNKEKHSLSTRLYDNSQHIQISISQVLLHKNLINFFLSSTHGSIYDFDRYSNSIKSSVKICNTQIHDIMLIRDSSQLLTLYGPENIIILSTVNLNKIYTHRSYNQSLSQPKFLLPHQDNLFVYSSRHMHAYLLNQNEDKKFNNIKPLKILRSRIKIRLKDKIQYKNSKQTVLKVIRGCGGEGDFLALILQTGQIMILNSDLEYIGSYHYLRVSSILQIVCNRSNQFISLLLDNNNIQVVNIYTQRLLFSINCMQNDRQFIQKNHFNSQGIKQKIALKQKKKGKNIAGQTIKLMSFISGKQDEAFFAYITSNNYVYHYSQKGSLLEVVNLQQRSCGDITNINQMLYINEQLVIVKNQNLILLHRKSYNRKLMMKVSKKPLLQVKRSSNNTLCAIDSTFSMFLVNLHNQESKCIDKQMNNEVGIVDSILFNQKMRIKIVEERVFVKVLASSKEHSFKIKQQTQSIALLNQNILKVNKTNNTIFRYNISLSQFEEISI